MQGNDADIIKFSRIQRLNMRFPLNNEVEAYWEGLRDGRPMPARSEIDPRGIERALSHTFILERVAPGMARFRLAGQHLNQIMGMEVRGMPVSALLAAESRSEFAMHLKDLFDGQCSLRIEMHAKGGMGRPALDAEMLLLPLYDNTSGIDRALGCMVSAGRPGQSPRRFAIQQVQSRGLSHTPQVKHSIPAFAEEASTFDTAPKCKHPHLRLVSSSQD